MNKKNRCTGFGICLSFKAFGSLIASPNYVSLSFLLAKNERSSDELFKILVRFFFDSVSLLRAGTSPRKLTDYNKQIEGSVVETAES